MGIVTLVAFWALIVWIWMDDGPKVPIIFIVLWGIGYGAIAFLLLSGYAWIAYQAILAVFLALVGNHKGSF